ncbi:hypothetical protein AAHB37_16175 [Glutamicibacter halophytocola]|uniref:hypothetical protein n=1 Tax=Glutamicibacter halophytocola TaxID=1933880 RepID=UPI003219A8FA
MLAPAYSQNQQRPSYGNQGYSNQRPAAAGVSREDQAAIEKYKYMLRTAPPQEMERAHAEAFSRLTPQQRALLQSELSEQLPAAERPASDRPQDLARAATRAEVSRPGFMEKILGSGSGRSRMAGGLAAGAGGTRRWPAWRRGRCVYRHRDCWPIAGRLFRNRRGIRIYG